MMAISSGPTASHLGAAAAPSPAIGTAATQAAGRPRHVTEQIVAYVAVWIICLVSLFPLYWMFENSLRPGSDADSTVRFWPESFTWSNYPHMWNALAYPFGVFLINSFGMCILVTVGTVVSCALVAYGFARFRFWGRDVLFGVVISTMMIPYAIMMIPQYALFVNIFHWSSGGRLFGYQNLVQFLPQIVPAFFGSPIFIFLLRQFILSIPYDLDEAAKVDGAGPFRTFWTIIVPELRPALATVTVLTFIGKWNDFLGPLIYLQDPRNWTIELALNGFVGRYGVTVFNLQMAAALMSMLPIAIIYFIASKQIIQGITLSGVKG